MISATFRAGDGWLDPKRLAMGYAAASEAPCVVETEVTGILAQGTRVTGLATTSGSVSAGAVVLAAGPFSGVLTELAGLGLQIHPTRRFRLVLPEVPEAPADAPMTIDEDSGAHWRPWQGGAHGMWTQRNVPSEAPQPLQPSDIANGLTIPLRVTLSNGLTGTGHSGHGVMSSAACARITLDAIRGASSPADQAFRWDRVFIPTDPTAL